MDSASSSESGSDEEEYAIESPRASVAAPSGRPDVDNPFETPEKAADDTTKKSARKMAEPSCRKESEKPTQVEGVANIGNTGGPKDKKGPLRPRIQVAIKTNLGPLCPKKSVLRRLTHLNLLEKRHKRPVKGPGMPKETKGKRRNCMRNRQRGGNLPPHHEGAPIV